MNPAAAAVPATPWLRAWSLGLGLALLLCLPLAEWMRPTRSTASVSGAIDLARQVPMQFAQWRVDPQWQPVMPDPQMQATLDSAYSQVFRVGERRQQQGSKLVSISIRQQRNCLPNCKENQNDQRAG